MKMKVHVFWLGHFARSKIESENIFLIKYYIITVLKKIGAFQSVFKNVKKNGFPIVFLKCKGHPLSADLRYGEEYSNSNSTLIVAYRKG